MAIKVFLIKVRNVPKFTRINDNLKFKFKLSKILHAKFWNLNIYKEINLWKIRSRISSLEVASKAIYRLVKKT